MKISYTPSGHQRIGALHKRPFYDRPFRCTLYKAYKQNSSCAQNLKTLLQTIKSGKFKPFFSAQELDSLASEHQFLIRSGAVFCGELKLESMSDWKHILNTMATQAVCNRDLLKDSKNSSSDENIAIAKELQSGMRKLKMAEDWLHYHQDILENIAAIKSGHPLNSQYINQDKIDRPTHIKRILIIDDSDDELVLAKRALKSLDLDVITIDPKQPINPQVINLILEGDIDLVLMDGNMPGTSGEALTNELREMCFTGYIVANSDSRLEQEKMLAAGADFANPNKDPRNFPSFFER